MSGDRGVSDLVGFIVIFTVVIASVGLVAAVGFDTLENVRDHDQLNSAEHGMLTLSDQLTGIANHHAPARATELRLDGATIAIVDGPTVNVTVGYEDGTEVTHTQQLRGVEYRIGDDVVLVAGGAVIRADGETSWMVREPPFRCTDDQARLNLITVRSLGDDLVSAGGSVQVQTRHDGTDTMAPANRSELTSARNVTVEFVSVDHPDAWTSFIEATDGKDAFRCEGLSNGLLVRHSRIGIGFMS